MENPVKDLDLVVEGDGPKLAHWVAGQLGGEVLSHPRFGTSTLLLGGHRVDFVSARRETYPRPGALPEVSASTIADDLARRDFTINALALHLGDRRPKIMDPRGGLEDIRRGLIRTLHPDSFVDDPTRVLRAVRYEQRLGFQIESDTLSQLNAAVAQGRLGLLSGDRVRHELERILQENRPALALNRIADLGILPALHPALGGEGLKERLDAIEAGKWEADNWEPGDREVGDRQSLDSNSGDSGQMAYVAALVYPLTPGQGEAVIQLLNLSAAWARLVRDVVLLRSRDAQLADGALEGSRLARELEGYCDEAVQAASWLTGSPIVARRLRKYLSELKPMAPALDGHDLLAMGVPEGPEIGRILRRLKESRQDSQVSNKDEERLLVKHLITQGS